MQEQMHCTIRFKGHLPELWLDWFGGFEINNQPNGEAILTGELPDQTALHGVLSRMNTLGIIIRSLECHLSLINPSGDPEK